MERVLAGIRPQRVFEIFEDICAIPHGSGNTKAVSDYCADFARAHGLSFSQDNLNNIIIRKPASAGYEKCETVVIQGHLDMVCEKEKALDFDFEHEGLRLKIEGDYISASGTTLGGDDGVAVAMALSILEDDSLRHPPLEVIFTTDEETGMYGAAGFDVSCVTAKRFINLDSENEGVFIVGCAGGVRVDINLPVSTKTIIKPAYKVEISGLAGGHSGTEINKGRLNANKVLGKFLSQLENVNISEISGGAKDNAIPVSAFCVFSCYGDAVSAAKIFVEENGLPTDDGLKITVSRQTAERFFCAESSKKVIELLNELPYGVITFSEDIKDLVETSVNLGVVRTRGDAVTFTLSLRSSKSAEKQALKEDIENIAAKFGAEVSERGDYPAWEYRKNSQLRDTMTSVFRELYGREPKIEIIHAGLECGLFSEKIKGIDAVSIGPDLFDIHTPRERLSISSLARTYSYICRVLEAL